jgi:transglutaminase-like putative cysteine protease
MSRRAFPLLLFPLILLAVSCEQEIPRISSISPQIGKMGDILTIYGEGFGDTQDESHVVIAGIVPTASAYVEWRDDLISLRTPEFGSSGLVYVFRGNKKSNPALYANQDIIPIRVPGETVGAEPRITSVSPVSGAIGSLVTILGNGFGSSRDGSGVYFTWNAEAAPSAPVEARVPSKVEVFENDFGYEFWSEREIRVRVPDGAISGGIEVRTLRGTSRPEFFDVTGKPGTKVFKDKRSYTVSYSVDIQVREASKPNTLYLWLPRPVSSASQRTVELLSRSREPFVENYRGTTLFQLRDMSPDSGSGINLSYQVEVYSVETRVTAARVRQERSSPIVNSLTLPTPPVPSDNPHIKRQAAAIIGRETNPYIKAQRIYQWLVREVKIQADPLAGDALDALNSKEADPYMAALLFCALARAAGVPALPVAGILVDRFPAARNHYWAEFWIDDFGWIPLDPALGAGAAPPSFGLRQDREAYYFGNLDNQRIAFSRGQTALSPMDPQGRVALRDRDYALQSLWEEAAGGLESYSSLWSDITITGMYVQ